MILGKVVRITFTSKGEDPRIKLSRIGGWKRRRWCWRFGAGWGGKTVGPGLLDATRVPG